MLIGRSEGQTSIVVITVGALVAGAYDYASSRRPTRGPLSGPNVCGVRGWVRACVRAASGSHRWRGPHPCVCVVRVYAIARV